MSFSHEAENAHAVDAHVEFEVNQTPKADFVDSPIICEWSGKDRENTLKLYGARWCQIESCVGLVNCPMPGFPMTSPLLAMRWPRNHVETTRPRRGQP